MSRLKPDWKQWCVDQMATSVNQRVDEPRQTWNIALASNFKDSDSLTIRC